MKMVADVMTRKLFTLHLEDIMQKADADMHRHCIRHLLVCDNDQLCGILSDLDVRKWKVCLHLNSGLSHQKVSDCMTRHVHTVRESDPLSEAVELLALGQYHALPVENEGGMLTGIITTTDMLHVLMEVMARELSAVQNVEV
jgi:CBS-domain-containing membrane protein